MTETPAERLLTKPLAAFLLVVATGLGWAAATRYPSPDLEGCIEQLADGDLDQKEREHVLARAAALAEGAALRGRVAGCLAALALEQRAPFEAHEDALARAGELEAAGRRWLDLGDPLLANVLRASSLDLTDAAAANHVWSQVQAQARMVGNRLAAELAARRLR
jgi:hypothetical protein